MPRAASLILGVAVMVCAAVAVYIALDWPWKAKLFPIAIGIPVFCLAVAEVVWSVLGAAEKSEPMDFQLSANLPQKVALGRALRAAAWILGFLAAIVLAGFPIAIPLFVFLYLKLQGGEGWRLSALFAALAWAFFHGVFDRLLHVPIPAGWLQGWLGLT